MLTEVRERLPEIARWGEWYYAGETNLRFDKHVVASQAGVQQGDPLGPLLFATATQELALSLREPLTSSPQQQPLQHPKLDLATFYLHDGFLYLTRDPQQHTQS